MEKISVSEINRLKFNASIRDFNIVIDQHIEHGGTDEGPTPIEYFIASIGGCVAVFAKNFLIRHNLEDEKVSVSVEWEMAKNPNRISKININFSTSAELDDSLKSALIAVVKSCTIHNSIMIHPEINIHYT